MKIIAHNRDVVSMNKTACRLARMGLPVAMTRVGREFYVWVAR